jgi:hypothetical protein
MKAKNKTASRKAKATLLPISTKHFNQIMRLGDKEKARVADHLRGIADAIDSARRSRIIEAALDVYREGRRAS